MTAWEDIGRHSRSSGDVGGRYEDIGGHRRTLEDVGGRWWV
jgi:hypothetical protein